MRHFGQFCQKGFAVSVLVLAFTCTALAGWMGQPVEPPPQPPTVSGEMQYPVTTDGEMQHPAAADPVTEFAVNVLQSALSLF